MEWDDILFATTFIDKLLNKMAQPPTSFTITKQELKQLEDLSFLTYNTLTQYLNKYSENITIITTSPLQWISNTLQLFRSIGYFKQIYTLLFNQCKIRIIHPKLQCLPFKSKKQILKYKEIAMAKVCCDPGINKDDGDCKRNSIVCFGDDLYKIAVKQTINLLTIHIHFVHKVKLKQFSRPKDIMEQLRFLQVFYDELTFDYFSKRCSELDVDYVLFQLVKQIRKMLIKRLL